MGREIFLLDAKDKNPLKDLYFKKNYLFLEKGEGGRMSGRGTSIPLGVLTCNPGMCPDWESNQQVWFASWCSIHGATPARGRCSS